jgi:AcrR family transcriptional regulator/DNA-binding MarR family transcriptional regulator
VPSAVMTSRDSRAGARKGARPGRGGVRREGVGRGGERRDGEGREKVGEIQRARILAAMTEVAAEQGAANVTVAHVVARSGVSRRTFYELFEDREACFLAAFDDATARIAARVVPAYEAEKRWQGRVRAGLLALLESLDGEPEMGRLCIVETLAAGPRALERRAGILEAVMWAVDEGRGEGRGKEYPPMAAEGVVGAVCSVLHARLVQLTPAGRPPAGCSPVVRPGAFVELLNPLMGMVVLPYLGAAAASRELKRPMPPRSERPLGGGRDPLRELDMRLTYRTVRVLTAAAQAPGASNRQLADAAGVHDQGQISKLLARLKTLGLIENIGAGPVKGEPNAWQLTAKGRHIDQAIQVQTRA